jgi:hypothetical protein
MIDQRPQPTDSWTRLPEVHQLPQRVVHMALQQLLAFVVLDAQLSGEPQVGAVEADEPGGRSFGPVEMVDELVRGEVGVPGERDDVSLPTIGVRVTGHLTHRLAG